MDRHHRTDKEVQGQWVSTLLFLIPSNFISPSKMTPDPLVSLETLNDIVGFHHSSTGQIKQSILVGCLINITIKPSLGGVLASFRSA